MSNVGNIDSDGINLGSIMKHRMSRATRKEKEVVRMSSLLSWGRPSHCFSTGFFVFRRVVSASILLSFPSGLSPSLDASRVNKDGGIGGCLPPRIVDEDEAVICRLKKLFPHRQMIDGMHISKRLMVIEELRII